jgi:hypothetical protein
VVEGGAEATLESLRGLIWGADANTTAVPMLTEIVGPERDPLLYGDNVDVTAAMQAGQIDAALFDLPTALYLSAVVVEGGVILGQFPADRSENPDQFGLLMEDGNPLKECVDAAITALTESGRLAEIEAEWLQEPPAFPSSSEMTDAPLQSRGGRRPPSPPTPAGLRGAAERRSNRSRRLHPRGGAGHRRAGAAGAGLGGGASAVSSTARSSRPPSRAFSTPSCSTSRSSCLVRALPSRSSA